MSSTIASPLSGRVALVTGGSRGIGRACCIDLAKAGCHIAINYHKNAEGAQETKKQIEQHSSSKGAKVFIYQCDVSEPTEVKSMVDKINKDLGTISILVNNAGIGSIRELDDITVDEFDTFLKVNLRSAFIVTQAIYPQMIKQKWGRIIFITSIAAYTGGPTGVSSNKNPIHKEKISTYDLLYYLTVCISAIYVLWLVLSQPHYSASKAGLIGLTNSYAQRLYPHGITSNAVSPGLVESDMLDVMIQAVGKEKVLQRTTGGHFGQPPDVANVVTMLATNEYVNGQTIGVDGGIYCTPYQHI